MGEMFGFVKNIPDWLRWVLLLPALIIANILFVLLISISGFLFPRSEILVIAGIEEILRPLGEPIIAFIVATNFAPKGKLVVGLVAIIYFFTIMGLYIFSSILMFNQGIVQNVIFELAVIIASIVGPIIPLLYLVFNIKK